MALSRKMLTALGIEADKIDEIISAHSETVSAIKDERDALKADAEKLKTVEEQLKSATAELEKFKSGDWEKKYTDLKSEYDKYKADVTTKETTANKTAAYKKLLKDAGVSEKRFDVILKVTNLNDIELDADGAIKDAEKLTEGIKSEWSDFITTDGKQGASTPTPPANNGGNANQPSRAAQMVAQYQNEHYGKAKEE